MTDEPMAPPPATASAHDTPDPRGASGKRGIPPVVLVLIAANVAMFCLEVALGADPIAPKAQKMLELGADFAPLTLHNEPWRLVSSMFLHFGIIHLAMNMLCLYQGRIVERLYGSAGFAALYLVAGLAGSVASMARSTNVVSAGASGAVFGVFGAFGAFLWMRKDRLDPVAVRKIARGLGTFVAINFAYGLTTPGIDMTAHIGGLIGGFASGATLLAGKDARRGRRAIGVAVMGVALALGAVRVIPSFTGDGRPKIVRLLARFDDIQPKAIAKYNELYGQRRSNAITDVQLADAVEHEVLPPWEALRKDLAAERDVSPELVPLVDKVVRFMTLREEAWLLLVKVLRDPAHTADDERAIDDKNKAADEAVYELNAALKNLSPDS